MGELGQDGSDGTIPLAGFARALLARTFIISRGHTGPCGQTRGGFKACHIDRVPAIASKFVGRMKEFFSTVLDFQPATVNFSDVRMP